MMVKIIEGICKFLLGVCFLIFALAILAMGGWFRASAQTLVPVSPPTDWTGVLIVAFVVIVAVAVTGYIVHIKRTPGQQFGEEEIERIAAALARKQQPVIVEALALSPFQYDGITFADQAKLDEYKAAKAIIDAHKEGKP